MSDLLEELMELSMEARQLSVYIGKLKNNSSLNTGETERNRLTEEFKMKQWQALFYIKKNENLSLARKKQC